MSRHWNKQGWDCKDWRVWVTWNCFRGIWCCPSESLPTLWCESSQSPVCPPTFCSPAQPLGGTEGWPPSCLIHIYTFSALTDTKSAITSGQEEECSPGCLLSMNGCRMLPETTILHSQLLSCSDLQGWDVLDAVITFLELDFQKKGSFLCYPEAMLARHSPSSWFYSCHSQLCTNSRVLTHSHFAKWKIYSVFLTLLSLRSLCKTSPQVGRSHWIWWHM